MEKNSIINHKMCHKALTRHLDVKFASKKVFLPLDDLKISSRSTCTANTEFGLHTKMHFFLPGEKESVVHKVLVHYIYIHREKGGFFAIL